MFVARILFPVEALGPGKRIGVWVSGCGRRCEGCSNPELWIRRDEQRITVPRLTEVLRRLFMAHEVDGITITGGEPFDQAEALAALVRNMRPLTEDILVYTGYTLEALRARQDDATNALLSGIAVLIDGEYRAALNDGAPLRGSSNQRIHMLNTQFDPKYEKYLQHENQIQNFTLNNGIVSVGIHRPDYETRLKAAAREKGLLENE